MLKIKALAKLRQDRSGLALLEFAFGAPLVLGIGFYGVETSNLALVNLRVSQIALTLADNASRVGTSSGLTSQQLREIDINDIFEGARQQGSRIDLLKNGRITLSSLENNAGTQRLHWQRCVGMKSGEGYDSRYGPTKPTDGINDDVANAGPLTPNGMGEAGAMVNAPTNSGVMFVEINYDHKPFVGWLMQGRKISYTASFIVRDRRDFSQIFNPSPEATRMTCDKYTA
jgi:Flp pilus assembly protein TadG